MTIFEAFLSSADSQAIFEGRNIVAAMLSFEAALATAQHAEGLVPASAAELIARICADTDRFDVARIAGDSARAGTLVIPLAKALKDAVRAADPAALPFVHLGSTSQDVIDTAMALLTRRAVDLVLADLHTAASACLRLAEQHAETPVLARTLLQPASVTSFGLKAAVWAGPLVRGHRRLKAAADTALQVQLGGAVGTLSQMKGKGPAVARRMAEALGLRAPQEVWHTQRDEWVALGCELGLVAGGLGKIGLDLGLMSQFELGELAEPAEEGRGVSSAMPHKRNPIAAMTALSAAQRVPPLVSTLLAAMPQAHERAISSWQAEFVSWPTLVTAVHGSVRAMAGALQGLVVDADRMRANIDTLRARIPADAADEWFAHSLAEGAGTLAREQATRLRADLG